MKNNNQAGKNKAAVGKPIKFKIAEYAKKNLIGIILYLIFMGAILLLFALYSSTNREVGKNSTRLDIYLKEMDQIRNEYDSYNEKFDSINELLTEVKSDVDNLKEGITVIRN
ncbi:MAG: hypothetical protein Q8O30_01415 [Candidatus Omnitrophota bacterium]|nr:hypothetical protein [Candidatus Omnitrophota bacterium]